MPSIPLSSQQAKTQSGAVITNIQGYSIHDGPGIRTVVFVKGCSLACIWCSNPENITAKPQIGFLEKLCHACGKCLDACPTGALSPLGVLPRIDHTRCVACGNCVDRCYYDALVRYGTLRSAEEVFNEVRKDKIFYQASGGGLTVSGGEPLLYSDFVRELFESCRLDGINTCIETAGNVPWKSIDKVLPYTDRFLFDIKLIDEEKHRENTGCSNVRILENACNLDRNGADILFRQPLIPGINDTETNIKQTAAFINSLEHSHGLQLMPFHKLGESKYAALGTKYSMTDVATMSDAYVDTIKNMYTELGIDCSVSR